MVIEENGMYIPASQPSIQLPQRCEELRSVSLALPASELTGQAPSCGSLTPRQCALLALTGSLSLSF